MLGSSFVSPVITTITSTKITKLEDVLDVNGWDCGRATEYERQNNNVMSSAAKTESGKQHDQAGGEIYLPESYIKATNADERMGSVFNSRGAADFNEFISNTGLIEVQLEGYSFTWSRPSASKMSKLDRPAVDNELSPDPFGVYDLLHKQNERKNNDESDISISHPPGFTPKNVDHQSESEEVHEDNEAHDVEPGSPLSQFMDLSSRVFEKVQRDKEHKSSDVHNTKTSSQFTDNIIPRVHFVHVATNHNLRYLKGADIVEQPRSEATAETTSEGMPTPSKLLL
nr:RNA-directed DNA polymerase, eukaryota [Tanacetum cinerariifolium]